MALCPICRSEELKTDVPQVNSGRDAYGFNCPKCGRVIVTGPLKASLGSYPDTDSNEKRALLSYAVRKMQKQNSVQELDTETVKNLFGNTSFPPPTEQADNFIIWFGENLRSSGETIEVSAETHQSVMGAKNTAGFDLVLEHLYNTGLLTGILIPTEDAPLCGKITLSMSGWERFEELSHKEISIKSAFMAMPYNRPDLDEMVEIYFKPAVSNTGFVLFRLDERPKAGLIDERLKSEINQAHFLIADLSHENAGVYWEAGYAEGLGKPVIYTCEKGKFESQKTHFDTNHHLTICWSREEPEKAVSDLKTTIRATLPDDAKLLDD